ncbi:hypothetical protein BDZ89DRAFT_1076903 [Hymenopellis radicata]|nr:hypothetical protein BDZ89DRAFT_1076903 [Hymenopellis radicata]
MPRKTGLERTVTLFRHERLPKSSDTTTRRGEPVSDQDNAPKYRFFPPIFQDYWLGNHQQVP